MEWILLFGWMLGNYFRSGSLNKRKSTWKGLPSFNVEEGVRRLLKLLAPHCLRPGFVSTSGLELQTHYDGIHFDPPAPAADEYRRAK